MRFLLFFALCVSLVGCNSIYMKPHTLDKNVMIYSPRAGFSMARATKQVLEKRGYDVSVGKLVRVSEATGGEAYQINREAVYAVTVKERTETLRPLWCLFNGFWWWNFNVSIIDRRNNDEILSWRGRGCANSSIRKFESILNELEKDDDSHAKKYRSLLQVDDKENIDFVIIDTQSNDEP